MASLERKIKALKKSKTNPKNLFENLTWRKGSYSDDGTVGTNYASNRCHQEEYIPVVVGEQYYVLIQLNPAYTGSEYKYAGLECYNANKEYMGSSNRIQAYFGSKQYWSSTFTPDYPYLRFSFKMFEGADVKLCKQSNKDTVDTIHLAPENII